MIKIDSLKTVDYPNGSNGMVPCIITKIIDPKNVSLRFECYEENYSKFKFEMQTLHRAKFENNLKQSDRIKTIGSLFILKRNSDYYRTKILETWSDGIVIIMFDYWTKDIIILLTKKNYIVSIVRILPPYQYKL
ncbi:hypothetical protein SSS_10307 [Sarcoptes scabiei]|nr:hypothetical protein SSS_10307 [Sarcoptes scabiei]